MMRRMRHALAFTLLCLTIGCSRDEAPRPPSATATNAPPLAAPTAAEAKALIEPSPEWGDYHFAYASWSVPLKRSAMNEAHQKTVAELREAGWLSLDGDGNVSLTPRAKNDRRFLERPNATLDIVPLAKKELVAVTSVLPQSDGNAHAIIEWRWVPNDVGASFKSGFVKQQFDAQHRARVTLMPSEGKWTVLLIEPVE